MKEQKEICFFLPSKVHLSRREAEATWNFCLKIFGSRWSKDEKVLIRLKSVVIVKFTWKRLYMMFQLKVLHFEVQNGQLKLTSKF